MAQYEEQNPLDYRAGGDTVDDAVQKYMKEIPRIYQFLNNIREHNSTGPNQVEPQPYIFKVTDNKMYIRNGANNAWLYLFDITYRMGMSDNPDAVILTSDDVTTTAEALKLVKTNADGDIDANITGNAAKFGNKTADQYVTVNDVSDAGAALKIVKTDSNGVAHVSISGSAVQLNGQAASYYLNVDDVATVPAGTVTDAPNKLVKTNANGVLPVDILGNVGKMAGKNIEVNNLQDGQVFTYRSASNSWRNEDKGVVGAGKALAVYDGSTLQFEYDGDAPQSLDLGTTATNTKIDTLTGQALRETAFSLGDTARLPGLPVTMYLECTTPGTSATTAPTITSPTAGDTVTDGTCVWTIRQSANNLDISSLNSRIDLVDSIAARDTAVTLGDTAMLEGIPAGYFLECTTAGTTGATAPVVTTPVSADDTITDGTCEWIVRKCFPANGGGALTGSGISWNGYNLSNASIVGQSGDYIKYLGGLCMQKQTVDETGWTSAYGMYYKAVTLPISYLNSSSYVVVANAQQHSGINVTEEVRQIQYNDGSIFIIWATAPCQVRYFAFGY